MIIFTIPKAFEGHIGIIQENALSSWVRLKPRPKIVLLGDDPGIKEAARKYKVRHLPNLQTNKYGTPILSNAVDIVKRKYRDKILALVHTDIILTSNFMETVKDVHRQYPEFLATGLRSDLKQERKIRFGKRWQKILRKRVESKGILRDNTTKEGTDIKYFNGSDYFIFTRNFYEEIPPFAIGRCFWDSWLQYISYELNKPWIDVTNGFLAVHQDHHYLHVKSHAQSEKKIGIDKYYKNPEMVKNFSYISGGYGIKEGWSRMFGPKHAPLIYLHGKVIKRNNLSLKEWKECTLKRNQGRYNENVIYQNRTKENKKKKVLCVQGAGIGNIIQCLPAIGSLIKGRYYVDLLANCNSSQDDFEVLKIPGIKNVFTSKSQLTDAYDFQLNGPHACNFQTNRAKKILDCRIKYQQDIEESFVFYDLVQSIGVEVPRQKINLNLPKTGYIPPKGAVAMFPGCKPSWPMKQWHLYDELCEHFPHVVLFGTREDVHPKHKTWFKKAWIWPDNAEIFYGNLKEVAYAISKCEFFIGNDGGIAHLAAATGIPTFVIFGPSSLIKNKPFGDNVYPIYVDLPCRSCQFLTFRDLNLKRPFQGVNSGTFGLTEKAKKNPQVFEENKMGCPFDMECLKKITVDLVLKTIGSKIQLSSFN